MIGADPPAVPGAPPAIGPADPPAPPGGAIIDPPAIPPGGAVMDPPAIPPGGAIIDPPAIPPGGAVMDPPAIPPGGAIIAPPPAGILAPGPDDAGGPDAGAKLGPAAPPAVLPVVPPVVPGAAPAPPVVPAGGGIFVILESKVAGPNSTPLSTISADAAFTKLSNIPGIGTAAGAPNVPSFIIGALNAS